MKQSHAAHAAHVEAMKHHIPTENFNSGQPVTSSGGPLSNLDNSRYTESGGSTSGTAHTVMEEMKKRHEQHGKRKGKETQHLNEMNL